MTRALVLFRKVKPYLLPFITHASSTTEDVATFASRLEDMVSKAVVVGKVNLSQTNEMLTSALKAWYKP